jgi:hypothetical protein
MAMVCPERLTTVVRFALLFAVLAAGAWILPRAADSRFELLALITDPRPDTSHGHGYGQCAGSEWTSWAEAPPRQAQLQAQRCLAGKRIVLVGDSRVRYQYLALLRLVAAGERVLGAPPGGRGALNHSLCHPLVCEKWFGDPDPWRNFLLTSNAALNVPAAGARERCDCARNETHWGDPDRLEGLVENRFFDMETQFGRISVSYFQRYKAWLHGHACFPPFGANGSSAAAGVAAGGRGATAAEPARSANGACCPPGHCGPPYDWTYTIQDFFDRVVVPLHPTHVLIHGTAAPAA